MVKDPKLTFGSAHSRSHILLQLVVGEEAETYNP